MRGDGKEQVEWKSWTKKYILSYNTGGVCISFKPLMTLQSFKSNLQSVDIQKKKKDTKKKGNSHKKKALSQ